MHYATHTATHGSGKRALGLWEQQNLKWHFCTLAAAQLEQFKERNNSLCEITETNIHKSSSFDGNAINCIAASSMNQLKLIFWNLPRTFQLAIKVHKSSSEENSLSLGKQQSEGDKNSILNGLWSLFVMSRHTASTVSRTYIIAADNSRTQNAQQCYCNRIFRALLCTFSVPHFCPLSLPYVNCP